VFFTGATDVAENTSNVINNIGRILLIQPPYFNFFLNSINLIIFSTLSKLKTFKSTFQMLSI
jgi:hypothetical protein